MRYYFYLLDHVVHAMFCIVTDIAASEPHEEWQKYKSKQNGRYEFQIDLAMTLIEWGIKNDWPYPFSNDLKPSWVRKQSPVPCDCTKCFYCSTGKTTGIRNAPSPTGVESRFIPSGCDPFPEKILLQNGRVRTNYCRPCYYKYSMLFKDKETKERQKMCNQTTFGCNGCGTYVCKDCYKTYSHNFFGNESHPYNETY
jgi:hypothetical protein